MKAYEFIESLNLEKGNDGIYYVNWLKERGIKASDHQNIIVKAVRCHFVKYGEIQVTSLIKLVEKYDLDKKALINKKKAWIADVQEQIYNIWLNELEKSLQEVE